MLLLNAINEYKEAVNNGFQAIITNEEWKDHEYLYMINGILLDSSNQFPKLSISFLESNKWEVVKIGNPVDTEKLYRLTSNIIAGFQEDYEEWCACNGHNPLYLENDHIFAQAVSIQGKDIREFLN